MLTLGDPQRLMGAPHFFSYITSLFLSLKVPIAFLLFLLQFLPPISQPTFSPPPPTSAFLPLSAASPWENYVILAVELGQEQCCGASHWAVPSCTARNLEGLVVGLSITISYFSPSGNPQIFTFL